MERFLPMLLQVWQQACRHIRIDESVGAIAAVVSRRLPFDLMLVRRLNTPRLHFETVAAAGMEAHIEADHAEPAEAQLAAALAWCRSGIVLRASAAELAGRYPALLPARLEGHVLAGGLNPEGGPLGLLVLHAVGPHGFSTEHEPLFAALLDPLTVALANDSRVRELAALREAAEADRRSLLSRLGRQDMLDTIIGAESGLKDAMRAAALVAPADAPVLVLGETGTGKEVLARTIHNRSRRAEGPFIRVNCGAISPELIDSELFGHERGSFTGASSRHQGWFERADGGTLFLDEVGELSAAAQVRLLRILQDGTFHRVGGQHQQRVDVRVVAATHRDLRAMVAEGRFREDLWYRMAVFPIRLPALRERRQDIPAMARHFALRAAQRLGLPPQAPTPEDNALLVAYAWPGNVRELASVMERAAILGNGNGLEVAQALGVQNPPTLAQASAAGIREDDPKPQTLDQVARDHIEAILTRTLGRIEGPFGAARLLGVNPHTLRARMRKLGIDWRRFRLYSGEPS